MNELEDKILEVLTTIEPAAKLTDENYKGIDEHIHGINLRLCIITIKKLYRIDEKKNKNRAISDKDLDYFALEKLKEWAKKDPFLFYFPSYLGKNPVTGKEGYFNDEVVLPCIIHLIKNDFKLPSELTLENITEVRCSLLAIKKALSTIASNKEATLFNVIIKSLLFIQHISYLTDKANDAMRQEDRQREEISSEQARRAAQRTDNTLQKILSHNLYPEIEKVMGSDKKTSKKKNETSRLILRMEIDGITTGQTADRYAKEIMKSQAP